MACEQSPWNDRDAQSAGLVSLILCALITLGGCGTTERVEEEASPETTSGSQEIRFEVHTDTVDVVKQTEETLPSPAVSEGTVQFAVQIGAFKDPENARTVADAARKRFSHPVTDEFDKESGLYLVRVGRFESRDTAHELRLEMQRDFRDCWIVQVRQ
ncbi:MAG: SPOR domain-containing protein [Bacteroidetes bacterium]|nr:SPOR domain-containing protein [Bacteroidota bacterium]